MKHVRKAALAASAFACAALFSFGWAEQGGISLSVESAQARVGRPLTPVSAAGVARRHNRRAGYYASARVLQQPPRLARSRLLLRPPGVGETTLGDTTIQDTTIGAALTRPSLILSLGTSTMCTGPIMDIALITVFRMG
jgi:hypothetical protein